MYKNNKWKRSMAVLMVGVMVSSQTAMLVCAAASEKESVTVSQGEKTKSEDTKETTSKEKETASKEENKNKGNTKKEEVVYANLDADGEATGVYVVNIFRDAEEITDYGDYTSIRNMNTTDNLTKENDKITAKTNQKSLFYEGTLEKYEIPWNISVQYEIDKKTYSAQEMAGKSGKLNMKLNIKPNKKAKEEFRKGYTLQITMLMDGDHWDNIKSDGATVANIGKDTQLTYIIFPNETKTIQVSANVTDFEMNAIAVNGVKMELGIDADSLESDELKNRVKELQDGVTRLNDGAKPVNDGSHTLQTGAAKVQEGIASLQNGLNQLNANSASLVNGSNEVNQALQTIQTLLSGIGVGQNPQDLVTASSQIRDGIQMLENSLAVLSSSVSYEGYKAVFAQQGIDLDWLTAQNDQAGQQLQQAAASLAGVLPQEQVAMLTNIGQLLAASNGVISGTKTYLDTASQNIQAIYNGSAQLKQSYETYYNVVAALVQNLSGMIGNMTALMNAIQTLAAQYTTLNTGIANYTESVAILVKGCNTLAGGMQELVNGCSTLADGTKQVLDGTGELKNKTANLENEMKDMIAKELDSKMGKDVKIVSFVSDKNKNIKNVQFVIQTKAIKMPEKEVPAEETEEKQTFWQKLLHLFEK